MYADSIAFLFDQWMSDDYSHGMFVPFISAFLAVAEAAPIASAGPAPSWWGPLVVLAGLSLYVVGNLATLYRDIASLPVAS
jgi:hypothetical protein